MEKLEVCIAFKEKVFRTSSWLIKNTNELKLKYTTKMTQIEQKYKQKERRG